MPGCSTWNAVSPVPNRGAEIRVAYQPPRDVVGSRTGQDSVRAAGVTQLTGLVTRAVADTLYVQVIGTRQVRGSTGRIPGGAIVAVTQSPGATITQQRLSLTNTLITLGVIVGVLALLLSTAEWEYDTPPP